MAKQIAAPWKSGISSLRNLALICAALAAPTAAAADVFEIAADGEVIVLAGSPSRVATPPPAPNVVAPPRPIAAEIVSAADRHGLSPALVDSIAHVESRYNQAAVSPKGAIGIMQLMPGTARQLGVDPHSRAGNLDGGSAYLRQMLDRFDGDLVRAVAAYNAGPRAVERARGVPAYAETRAYVDRVLARLSNWSQ